MTKPLHKAVIVLGFGPAQRFESAQAPALNSDGTAVRRAVREALAAGLKELIFVTPDSMAPIEAQFGDAGSGKAERVVVARQFAAGCLGEALCGVRHLLDEQPFVLLLPNALGSLADEGLTARLVAAYRQSGGNLVAVDDNDVLRGEGSFAAIRAAAAGRYLLQPAVLDALEEDPQAGIAAALLDIAEAWPVVAVPAVPHEIRPQQVMSTSDAPTLRGPRPVPAAAAKPEGSDWPGSAGL